jgi:hypothetical protein
LWQPAKEWAKVTVLAKVKVAKVKVAKVKVAKVKVVTVKVEKVKVEKVKEEKVRDLLAKGKVLSKTVRGSMLATTPQNNATQNLICQGNETIPSALQHATT